MAIYLIHGKDVIRRTKFLTLQEALTQKQIIVHETGNVQQLEVENVSADFEVFIQVGDIVKGGKQDRVLSFDMLVPPRSGRVSIAACCVESGRWRQRGGEDARQFSESSGQAAMQGLLSRRPDVDAVFAASDPMAFGAMRAIKQAGRGIPEDIAHGTVRFSLSRETGAAELDQAAATVAKVVNRLRRVTA